MNLFRSVSSSRYCDGSITASIPAGCYTDSSTDDVDIFYKLLRQWRMETLWISSITEAINRPAFKKIVKMGEKVLPLILEEISVQPDLLVAALPIITGEDPVHETDRGNLPAMAIAWTEWYREHRC